MFPAGTDWCYSNTNDVMLAMVAEQVTGQPLRRLISDRIFVPLAMAGCSFPDADAAIPDPSSRGYMLSTTWDRPPTPPAPLPALVDVTDFNPSWAAGRQAGNLRYMSQTARRESNGTVIVVLSNLMIAPELTEPATAISELISRAIPPNP